MAGTPTNFFDNMKRMGGALADRAKGMIGLGEAPVQTGAAEGPISNPNVQSGPKLSGEATKYVTDKAALDAKFAQPAAPGRIATGLRTAGKVAPALAVGAEAYDATSNIMNGENPVKSIGRAALRGGATLLGGAAGALGGGGIASVPLAVGGGALGYKLGDMAADYIFGQPPQAQPSMREAPVRPGAAPAPAPEPVTGPQIPVMSQPGEPGGTARPEALMAPNSDLVPQAGYGGIKRTGVLTGVAPGAGPMGTDRNVVDRSSAGPARGLGNGDPTVVAPVQRLAYERAQAEEAARQENAPAAAGAGGLRGVPIVRGRGITQFKADAENARNAVAMAGVDATRENNAAVRAQAAATLAHTRESENEKRVDQRTGDYVRAKNPAVAESLIPGSKAQQDYEAKVKQQTSDVNERIRHTVSLTNGSVGALAEPTHSVLLKANDFRERAEEARKGALPWATDFFGNKRFDSKNLLSYLPARDGKGGVKPALPEVFGYSVEMGNGNKVKVYKLAGGGFNLTGPNDPIDADAMELIKPAIEASQRARR